MTDALFSYMETLQGGRPWGEVLDAGTGRHSLRWLAGLETSRWAAVTSDAVQHEALTREFRGRLRPGDRLVLGNWTDADLLKGESFDVVLADYLIGAVDCYSPYFQYGILERLKPHIRSRLYLAGLEPYPEDSGSPGGDIILEIARLRDACILLAGHRCNREYPSSWVVRALESCGFKVEAQQSFPIVYGPTFINGQLDVCLQKLPHFPSRRLAAELERHVNALREKALVFCEKEEGIRFGEDYAMGAILR